MKKILIASLLLTMPFLVSQTHAHHSFSATFTNEIISVEGTVQRLRFANPHVLVTLSVEDDSGEAIEWVSEGPAATGMRREGWGPDTLKPGDYIRITGNSTRNGSPMVSMETVEFINPNTGEVTGQPGQAIEQEELASAESTAIPMSGNDGTPNLSGNWTRANNNRGGGGMTGMAAGAMGNGSNRGPRSPSGIAEEPAYTEEAAALQAEFDPVNDPQVQCEPPGLVRQAAFTPHPVRIEQHADHVVLAYEEYGGVRTIYFDDRDMTGGEKTHLGQSSARYEDDKLIIESNNLKGNLTGSGGYALSDQATTVETYYRLEDVDGRSMLRMDMAINDPEYLTEPWAMSWIKGYTRDYEFIEVECEKPL